MWGQVTLSVRRVSSVPPPDTEVIASVPLQELERAPGDPKWLDVIEKDLHRQFPFHEMFAARGGHG